MAHTFDSLLEKCSSSASLPLLKDSISCYNSGVYRMAIVSAWQAAFFGILTQIHTRKEEDDGLSSIWKNYSDAYAQESKNSHSQIVTFEQNFFNTLKSQERIDLILFEDLEILKQLRHRYAHPKPPSIDVIIHFPKATAEEARHCISIAANAISSGLNYTNSYAEKIDVNLVSVGSNSNFVRLLPQFNSSLRFNLLFKWLNLLTPASRPEFVQALEFLVSESIKMPEWRDLAIIKVRKWVSKLDTSLFPVLKFYSLFDMESKLPLEDEQKRKISDNFKKLKFNIQDEIQLELIACSSRINWLQDGWREKFLEDTNVAPFVVSLKNRDSKEIQFGLENLCFLVEFCLKKWKYNENVVDLQVKPLMSLLKMYKVNPYSFFDEDTIKNSSPMKKMMDEQFPKDNFYGFYKWRPTTKIQIEK